MSRNVTNRPSVAGAQRAGRGRERGQDGSGIQQHGDTPPSRPTVADRTQRREAYTVIAPDEEKRKMLQEKAAEEEQRFQQFRERNRLHHVSYVGIVGDSDEAVASAAGDGSCGTKPRAGATNAPPKQTAFDKSRQYRAMQRQREETENTKKKQEQRLKASANEDREHQRKERLDEDRKKKMNDFLNRFENKSKLSTVSREAAAATAVTSSDSQEPEGDQSEASCDNDSSSSLDLLCSAFPNHSREELQDLLMVCNGDVDSVFGMLTD